MRSERHFQEMMARIHGRTSKMFLVLTGVQYVGGIVLALVKAPFTYEGGTRSVHPHVWMAVLLGAAIASVPVWLMITRPTATVTRMVVSGAQMLWSGLLIHLTGGRIETHFHVFGSLAFVAFYRDWRALVPATGVVVVDHLLRGLLWPESVYGFANPEWWRFLEHAGWVVFEDVVLVLSCVAGRQDARRVAERQADVELTLEEVKRLNAELDQRVTERTAQLSTANDQLKSSFESLQTTQRQLVEASRMAGKAEVATAVLHNVGNVLNSITVASGAVAEKMRSSRAAGLSKASELLSGPELSPLLAAHPKGPKLIAYVAQLDQSVKSEQAAVIGELTGIQKNIEHIRVIVGRQQSHAKEKGSAERVALDELCQEAVSTCGVDKLPNLSLAVEAVPGTAANADRHKVLQIVMNLVSNARHAALDGGRAGKVTVRTLVSGGFARIEVEDDGYGIAPENAAKIFKHGFTTKNEGHGFGLHGSACFAMEMGGRLTCHSDGPGKGACFVLELPRTLAAAA
ncbi:MAG: HAMP domain-containing sensor histidine kinase [Myxococcaceae bacterium]